MGICRANLNKSVIAGHVIISFDNVINGFLTVVMAPLFFDPAGNSIIQLLSSYAAYAALFLTGPIGATIFGRLGDKFGRRRSLLISILGIGFPVFIIGILPTYETIGIAAPILLIGLRMIQGLFKGSEYSGVLIHNYEEGNKNTGSSASVISYGCIGGCVAALTCFVVTLDGAPSWSWRIPYLIGGCAGFIVFFLRKRVKETDDYLFFANRNKYVVTPMKDIYKNFKFELFVGIAISACYNGTAYSAMMFGNRLFQQAGYPVSHSMLYSIADLLWIAVSIKIFGVIADKIGFQRQMRYGILSLMLASIPACLLISGELTLLKIYAYMGIMTFLSASIVSCSAIYVSTIFPIQCRYSGFSITDSLGAVVGGFTPFMMLLLSDLFGSNFWCVLWIQALTIPAFLLTTFMNKKMQLKTP